MDDVADLLTDTAAGAITAPGYLLISQGQLAEALQPLVILWEQPASDGESSPPNLIDGRILAPLWASGLLHRDLVLPSIRPKLLPDDSRERGPSGEAAPLELAGVYVRGALANTEGDLALPLALLCKRRREEKEGFLRAMRDGDADAASRRCGAAGRRTAWWRKLRMRTAPGSWPPSS